MKRLSPSAAVVALSLGTLAPTPVAHANVESGGMAGVHVFNEQNELGVNDIPDGNSQKNSLLVGLRIGVYFTDIIGVEGEFGVLPTEARTGGFGTTDLTYRAH